MLVLARKIGKSIIIDNDVVVTVVGISGQQVRLGITAPKTTSIYREEIYQKVQHQKRHEVVIELPSVMNQ